ncbi:tyrosine-type recombinase/integrase, partial [Salinibacter altiplanensis]|uniref:tyrosine-type recombinase/integrase n=1 Tax=Salinibacter altiplanensis TaxID=1803181 RepID=UPI001F3E99C9
LAARPRNVAPEARIAVSPNRHKLDCVAFSQELISRAVGSARPFPIASARPSTCFLPIGRPIINRIMSGKQRDVPLHHKAKDYLDSYLEVAGDAPSNESSDSGPARAENLPLFRTMTREKTLSDRPMSRTSVLRIVKSRAKEAGFAPSRVCCHTFRGTGITAYLENGGKLEVAQYLAGHADALTTKLYDRRRELVSKEEVEKIGI